MMTLKHFAFRALIVLGALMLSALLFIFMVVFDQNSPAEPEKLIVNKIDVAVIAPPPPPPPLTQSNNAPSNVSAINVMGLGGPVKVQYGNKNVMQVPKSEELDLPMLELDKLEFVSHFSSKVPMLKVEHLDRVPKVVSQRYIKPPKAVRKYGQKRIETSVELIIDQTGKPYVKKIIDPVFPEMIETIRTWVKHAKFEIPKKEGKAVQAVYLYGINFNYG
ncbi:hypothetical protein A7985_05280 [Pseudoalteromonas luteoviolacea]|uniref:TonB C-terminal domain-containing protein n=1 Tax=Pseudoalteromonas luteoviolacea TaxID=43657 RepID=A0A1C0TVJ8_9GAMM|nr:hypothetical protein [Pseudoalteromonas luteoviolacea]MBQ4809916.1 hypothetical protein [Pseudoalteromonas luteoviolacea]OCQ23356.1 hypothetical protein A7985_05280 [Pseudoalteromonas luteoviolacea]